MPILGLVLSLDRDCLDPGGRTLEALRAWPDLELGELQGVKLPVVLECVKGPHDPAASVNREVKLEAKAEARVEAEVEALRNLAGIAHIDVVFAEFADLLPDPDPISIFSSPERAQGPDNPGMEMEPKSWS